MRIDDLARQPGEWLRGTGPDNDIVMSSRIRLARNLAGRPFLTVASHKVRAELEVQIRGALDQVNLGAARMYVSLKEASAVDRQFLMERHLISRDLLNAEGDRGVAIAKEETVAIMVNEEDHLRLQVLRSGLQLHEAWKEIDRIDDELSTRLPMAFHAQFGYLTACPTNAGTGMRISVLLHLPALVMTRQIDKVFQALSRISFSVRGLYGEGTQATGNFYQISNQATLGKSEQKLIDDLSNVVPEIVKFERHCREKLANEQKTALEDRVMRACGTLRYARTISSEETMELLSAIRLGSHLSLLPDIAPRTINELFISTQPGHLQKHEGRPLSPQERDLARAGFIRGKLSEKLKNSP
ncbi:MAG: protein arginine kinase [Planctomycetes bacterium]|nr:protein arginine kinase [Planctomycetota bacterium]